MSAIVESIQKICRDQPNRPLIFLPGRSRTITASAIWDQYLEHVNGLKRAGLSSGDLIVSATGNRPDLIPLLVACRSLGVVLMALDIGATHAEIVELGARFGAGALVLPESTASGGEFDRLEMLACDGERQAYRGAAMLKLTSGSTGLPRATFTTEAQLIADGRQIAATMGIGAADRQVAAIPLSHSYGLGVVVMPLLLQGTAMVLRESFVPHKLADDAEEFGPRLFPGVPFMFEYLLDHPPAERWPPLLNRLASAGAPLSPVVSRAFHRRFGVKVHAYYGTTETGGISFDETDDPEIVDSVGRALEGVEISLRAEADVPGGRVHVRSPAVSDGYVGLPRGDFTDEGFLTGDFGTMSADGRLTLSGRVSAFINVAGRKVQPDEVEATLRSLTGVAEVRVVAGHDDRRGEHVVACIVRHHQSDGLTPMAVRRFCADRLAPYKIPREVVFVEAIPLTPRGKTDRAALAAAIRAQLKQEA